MKFRTLRADEIECRVAMISDKGVSLLLYKDARADMIILDETVGAENWQREHRRDNANCMVSIWDEKKKQWICKEDTGTENNTEKEKGLASDSFKRACVNWGIGRELYTAPFIWVSADKISWYQKNGKNYPRDKFRVAAIAYDDRKNITALSIVNDKGVEVYRYSENGSAPQMQKASEKQIALIIELAEKAGMPVVSICKKVGVSAVEDIPAISAGKIIDQLKGKLAHG
jgi:hypothetical protein